MALLHNNMVTAMADILMQGLTPDRQELVRPVITLYRQGLIDEDHMIDTLQHIMEKANSSPSQAPGKGPPQPKHKAPPACLVGAKGTPSWAQVAIGQPSPMQMPLQPSSPMQMPSQGMMWDPATNVWYMAPSNTMLGKGRPAAGGPTVQGNRGRGKKGGKKGGGKGKDIFAASFESAEQNLQVFLERHPNFVFRGRDDLPPHLDQVWKVLGEHNDRMYKNLVKHFDNPDELEKFLREMAQGTTWPVDRWNEIEQASLKKKQDDGRSSVVSRFSGISSYSRFT